MIAAILAASMAVASPAERDAMRAYHDCALLVAVQLEPSGEALHVIANIATRKCPNEFEALVSLTAERVIENEHVEGLPDLTIYDVRSITRESLAKVLIDDLVAIRARRLSGAP